MRNVFKPLVVHSEFLAVLALLVLWASTTFSMALMQVTTVLAIVFWVLQALKNKTAGSFGLGKYLWVFLLLFFVWVTASFFGSEFPKQGFRGVLKIAKPLLVFLMCASLFRSETAQKRFDLAFLITFLLVTVDCSIQYAFGKDVLRGFSAQDSSAGLRLVGGFGDFGKMATYLILVFPVFLMRFWSEFCQPGRRKNSFYALALAATAFTLLYLTRCRGPVIALAISLFCLFVYKRWFKMLGAGLVLFITLLAFTPRSMIIHLDAESKEQSIVERIELWKRAWDVIEAKPWLGTGINTYDVAHEKYDTNKNWRVRGYYAHNGYLQLAAEIGIPGILFFLAFLLLFFIQSARAAHAVRGSPEELIQLGMLTGLFAFLLYALADTNLQSPQSLMSFWFLAGILLARQKNLAE